MKLTPNRVATILGAVGALAAGLSPVVANMDWSSTAGVIAGILGAVALVDRWLAGWQKHEAMYAAIEPQGVLLDPPSQSAKLKNRTP